MKKQKRNLFLLYFIILCIKITIYTNNITVKVIKDRLEVKYIGGRNGTNARKELQYKSNKRKK